MLNNDDDGDDDDNESCNKDDDDEVKGSLAFFFSKWFSSCFMFFEVTDIGSGICTYKYKIKSETDKLKK